MTAPSRSSVAGSSSELVAADARGDVRPREQLAQYLARATQQRVAGGMAN